MRQLAMKVRTFKKYSDFRNGGFLDIDLDRINCPDYVEESTVRANVVSANRTEQNGTEQVCHYAVRRFFTHIHKSRNGVISLCSGIFVFKLSGDFEE